MLLNVQTTVSGNKHANVCTTIHIKDVKDCCLQESVAVLVLYYLAANKGDQNTI